ncbi:hypothetical protein [Brevundimonas naejangsanensis]
MKPSPPFHNNAYAVLTGDLVNSSRLDAADLDHQRQRLYFAVEEVRRSDPDLIIGDLQFFRGDSWQLALRKPGLFLRMAVLLRAALLSELPRGDTRIAVGLGPAELLDETSVSKSVGEAFTRSGLALDEMGRRRSIEVSAAPDVLAAVDWLPPLLGVVSAIVGRWTEKQARVAMFALHPGEIHQKDIAHRLGLSQQGVSKLAVNAELSSILTAIDYVEQYDWASLIARFPPPATRFRP